MAHQAAKAPLEPCEIGNLQSGIEILKKDRNAIPFTVKNEIRSLLDSFCAMRIDYLKA